MGVTIKIYLKMRKRFNFYEKGSSALIPLFEISKYLKSSTIGKNLLELVYFRVSQINGCGYCLDMHSKELIANGESPQGYLL